MSELFCDLFAGGGGASEGIRRALGVSPDIAINHDVEAVIMHTQNHPETQHFCEDAYDVDPLTVTKGRDVGLLWASPDCTHFSRAKGGKPVEKRIRGLAWVVIKWAKAVRPRVIILENVPEFKTWGPTIKIKQEREQLFFDLFRSSKFDIIEYPNPNKKGMTFRFWVNRLRGLGYKVDWRELSACDYGAPTIRKRLFLIARCDGQPIIWPKPTHGKGLKPYLTAAECIDWSIPCQSIFDRKKPLAEATLRRIARGLQRYVIEAKEPFIVTCNHGGDNFRGQGLNEPFKTITAARDAHGLVVPYLSKYHGVKGNEDRCSGMAGPIPTIDTSNRFALVTAFLSKYYAGVVGADVRQPMPTVTAIDHNALVAAHITKFYSTNIGSDMREPLPTITGGGQHLGEVMALLTKHCGGVGAVVTVAGEQYQIADIGLRMLTPRELARAQGFSDDYILTGSNAVQVAKIGNSVCPPIAEALVRANVQLQNKTTKVG